MSPQSMTGYSRLTRATPHGAVTVELRSTNHRFLEIDQRLPDGLTNFSADIAQLVRAHVRRGRVEVQVHVRSPKRAAPQLSVDYAYATAYARALRELAANLRLSGSVTLDQVLASSPVVRQTNETPDRQAAWSSVRATVRAALNKLLAMRRAEGQRLLADVRAQAQGIARHAAAIRKELPKSAARQKARLAERVKTLVGPDTTLTTGQLQEAIAVVRDVDIHEELVRLNSHLVHLRETLRGQHSIGKKVDFIAQELVREANTIGAKANDAVVARHVVEIKGAIEKIREQAQNLD